MTLLPMLSGEVQRRIDEFGVPVPVVDENGRVLMLLEPVFTHVFDGYSARLPGINAFAEGSTREEAAFALREALQAYNKAFGSEL
jgi:hypothetical protein